MITQPPSVMLLRQKQLKQPPPAIKANLGCYPSWDIKAAHKLAKCFAWLIRQCDTLLKKSAIAVTWLLAMYIKARSFASAHKRGLVSKKTLKERLRVCNAACPWHNKHDDGREYCDKIQSNCNCGDWAASSIQWRIKLKTFSCPEQRFKS